MSRSQPRSGGTDVAHGASNDTCRLLACPISPGTGRKNLAGGASSASPLNTFTKKSKPQRGEKNSMITVRHSPLNKLLSPTSGLRCLETPLPGAGAPGYHSLPHGGLTKENEIGANLRNLRARPSECFSRSFSIFAICTSIAHFYFAIFNHSTLSHFFLHSQFRIFSAIRYSRFVISMSATQ